MSQENVEVVRGPESRSRLSAKGRVSAGAWISALVRFPALYPLLADAFMRLPPRSRLRRLMLARTVGRHMRQLTVETSTSSSGLGSRDSEYRPSGDLLPPDLEPVSTATTGTAELWRYWLDAFEDIRWDPEEILDFGDRLLVTTQQRGRGSGSGVAVSEPVFQLFTFRRGLVVRQEDFLDRSKALEAVGAAGVGPLALEAPDLDRRGALALELVGLLEHRGDVVADLEPHAFVLGVGGGLHGQHAGVRVGGAGGQ